MAASARCSLSRPGSLPCLATTLFDNRFLELFPICKTGGVLDGPEEVRRQSHPPAMVLPNVKVNQAHSGSETLPQVRALGRPLRSQSSEQADLPHPEEGNVPRRSATPEKSTWNSPSSPRSRSRFSSSSAPGRFLCRSPGTPPWTSSGESTPMPSSGSYPPGKGPKGNGPATVERYPKQVSPSSRQPSVSSSCRWPTPSLALSFPTGTRVKGSRGSPSAKTS